MIRLTPPQFALAIFATVPGVLLEAQSPTTSAKPMHFVAEFAGNVTDNGEPLALDVTFSGQRPGFVQIENVLRNCLKAAIAIHPGNDISANAWHSETTSAAERSRLQLKDGAGGLMYVAMDQTTHIVGGGNVAASAAAPQQDNVSAILKDAGVVSACSSVPSERMTTLIAAASEAPGTQRKHILKAMRTWCKDNDVSVDRSLRSCMSAMSKAIVANASGKDASPVDLAAAISRGATGYANRGCTKCHLASGAGGVRGPSLIDTNWEHCDGTIEGIRKVLVSGVPRNKLKDTNRPFAMNPVGGQGTSKQDLADLAAYVHSLSQN